MSGGVILFTHETERRWAMKKVFLLKVVLGILLLTVMGFPHRVATAADEIEEIQRAIEAKGANWKAGENWVTKLPPEERKKLCGAIRKPLDPSQMKVLSLPQINNLPPIFDWRDNDGNWVTPVRNQGDCGSCWAFSAVAQVESWWKIYNQDPTMIDLSEQFLLSCSEGSCEGWPVEDALDFIQSTGIPTEECFEYMADDEIPCSDACSDWADEAVTIPGWGYITLVEDNIETIKNAVFRHPVSANFSVYEDFYSYSEDVYEHVWGEYSGRHAILIVGWHDGEESWICKNSWDDAWGEEGYFRIKWGDAGIGEYMPFIWNEMTSGPTLAISPDQIDLSLVVGESSLETITITNSGSDVMEFFAMDYEVPVVFHPDAFMAWDDYSWWSGDPQIGGYGNHWLQYLDTPVLDLSNTTDPRLSWMGFWSIEDPAGAESPYDGWDGCNIWISADGGETFGVAQPDFPPYNCQSLWSFGHPEQGWNFGVGIAGWGGSSGGWTSCEFDLTNYRSNSVVIRFAFASDKGLCTEDDPTLYGFFADEIQVSDGGEVLFQDHGDNVDTMTRTGYGEKENTWIDISDGMGVLHPTESTPVTLTINTSDSEPGSYRGRVHITSNDPTNPEVEIPVNLHLDPAAVDTGCQTELIAHYPLRSDANDITGNQGPMTLINTPFQEGGIYCNGIYEYSGNPDWSGAITPALEGFDFTGFSISARFKVAEYPSYDRPVFMGGRSWRWMGFYLNTDGTVKLKYNNSNYQSSGMSYSLDTWYKATVTYDAEAETGKMYLDDILACTANFQIDHGNDRRICTTDYSNGATFKGIMSDLKIYDMIIDPTCITITSPNGGENWAAGEIHNVTWTSQNTSGGVRIEYSTNNGSNWRTIVLNAPDAGSYAWTIPFLSSSNCLVRIWDAVHCECFDASSNPFTIYIPCQITVTAPNGDESFCADEVRDITWTSQSTSGNVKIEYSTNGGSSWDTVSASTPDNGSYSWIIPNTPSLNCLVEVCDGEDPECCDRSDEVYKISECGPLHIVTDNLPDGYLGCPYYVTLSVSGGVLPYSWSIVSGTIPSGLNFESATGIISGVPDSRDTFCFTVKVEDGVGASDEQEYCQLITEYTDIKGDANYDGVINIVDVVTVVNILLGIDIPSPEQACSADCNGPQGMCDGDGSVDVLDAVKIVNLILELDECP